MYLIFKAFHLIAMVAWFAGLFYLFRLFVYHVENADKPEVVVLFKKMAYRLERYIMTPAMVVTWILGLCTLSQAPHLLQTKWFPLKFLLLLLLSGYHSFCVKTRLRFAKDDLFLTSKQCRILNEVPTLFLISIILLAVFKPF